MTAADAAATAIGDQVQATLNAVDADVLGFVILIQTAEGITMEGRDRLTANGDDSGRAFRTLLHALVHAAEKADDDDD